jgi:hypothetical protein
MNANKLYMGNNMKTTPVVNIYFITKYIFHYLFIKSLINMIT